ncbi:MAG TPA: CHRD domain-containing protein [Thermoanaerobaculia bacterium]|nr:CHRD domain-containing protein [Thermoanaerobaculia bacterium]
MPFLLLSMSASAQTFVATLNGANEAPGPGDPDGAGFATITFVGTTVNYSIVVTNITLPPIGQHIHIGGPGVPGPIVVNLPGTWVGNTLNGSTTSDPATIAAIVANPGGYYVNVHTTDFPGGAVRGQLAPFGSAAGGVPTLSFVGMLALAAGLALIGIFVARSV